MESNKTQTNKTHNLPELIDKKERDWWLSEAGGDSEIGEGVKKFSFQSSNKRVMGNNVKIKKIM